LKRIFFDMASSYEDAANPALAEVPGDGRRNLKLARTYWEQAAITIQQIEKQDTSHEELKAELASAEAHIAGIRIEQRDPDEAETLSNALAALKSFAIKDGASVRVLNLYVTALIDAGHSFPPHQTSAISCAEREVALTHRKDTTAMLALAQVYRATGQIEEARQVAKEALALLPPLQTGAARSNIRKQLELEAQGGAAVGGKAG